MESIIAMPFHVPGTLSANITVYFTAPFDMQLVKVQSVNTVAASNATLIVGASDNTDAYLESHTIGNNSVPLEKGRADFVGAQYPHIAKGTVVVVTVDFDGSTGTAAANLTVILFFTKG